MFSDNVTENQVVVMDDNDADAEKSEWGDFAHVISDLTKEEQPEAPTEPEPDKDKGEAMAGFVDVAFVVIEQVTSVISGFDFTFDEKGKQKVIEAAAPVLSKHSNRVMVLFGNYVEEATLFVAVLALVFSAKKTINQKKQEALINGQEAEAVAVS